MSSLGQGDVRFKEIEHKFIVGEAFDLDSFRQVLQALEPVETTSQSVRDVYYLTRHQPGYIYRHRHDRELQHLTVKSLEADAEVRLEVNLDLGQHRGDQQEVVEAFLDTLGVVWRGVVKKEIEVYYFADCEIVYYAATAGSRTVHCVELEAIQKTSLEAALAVLDRYEQRIGFAARERTTQTLVELLYPEIGSRTGPEVCMSHPATFTFVLDKQDFKFSCAHFIVFAADRAELLHGHNYRLAVELSGQGIDEEGLMLDLERVKATIRAVCARLDSRTLVPTRSRHLAVERRDGSVEITFRERSYRFPEGDVLLLEQINTSIEVLARMLWQELAAALEEPGIEELAVSVSGTSGQACGYRAPLC